MPNKEPLDEITWINHHLKWYTELDFDHLRPILCFSLIWNLFETQACLRRASRSSILKSVNTANSAELLEKDRYDRFINIFRARYVCAEITNDRFQYLVMDDIKTGDAIRKVLLNQAEDIPSQVYALLLIAYRIRNNFFHGNKQLQELPQQIELFKVANELLTTYLRGSKGRS